MQKVYISGIVAVTILVLAFLFKSQLGGKITEVTNIDWKDGVIEFQSFAGFDGTLSPAALYFALGKALAIQDGRGALDSSAVRASEESKASMEELKAAGIISVYQLITKDDADGVMMAGDWIQYELSQEGIAFINQLVGIGADR